MSHHVIPQRWVGRGAPHTTQNHTTKDGWETPHHIHRWGGGGSTTLYPHSSPPHHKGVWIILGDHRRGSRCMYTYILLNGYRYMSQHVTSQRGGEGSTTRHPKPHHKEGWGSPYHIHSGRVGGEPPRYIHTTTHHTTRGGDTTPHPKGGRRGVRHITHHIVDHPGGSSWEIMMYVYVYIYERL